MPGIDGLVHISQISHKRVENPKDVLSVGQDVTVKVLEVNADAERVSLSIKALEERPANAEGENNEKRQSRPRRPKRQEKRDYELPETQSGFSMADLFEISNCKIKKRHGNMSFLALLEYAIIVYC